MKLPLNSFAGVQSFNQPGATLNFFRQELRRGFYTVTVLTAFILAAALSSQANTYSWSGGGATGNWNDSANWGFAGTPANGDSLVFPAPSSLVSTTNNIAGLTLAQIRFAGGGAGYTLYGNPFTLSAGIEATNTIGGNTINNTITLGANIQVDVGNNAYLTLAGLLQGSAGITKIGAGTLIYDFSGNNTYSGTTAVNAGLLQLNVNGANAFAGPLVIGDGSGTGFPIVRLLQFSEMPDNQPVTVNLNGLLDLNNFSDTTGPLTIQGATVSTESGTLSLNGDLTVLGSAVEPMITGNLHFNGGLHVVNVADGPTFRDLDLLANVSDAGGGLLFTNSAPSGAFALLEGSNSFTGPLIVDNILLSVQTPTGLGTAAAGTTVGSHGELFVYSTGITNESLTMAAGATLYGQDNCVWNGPIVLNGNVTIGCYPSVATFTLNGVISGSGGFEKLDVGTLQLFGNAGNTYAGNTFIQDGLCLIDKSVGAAIPDGTLTIGDHSGTNATVRDINVGGNLGSGVALAINEGGLLDLNGESESISPITLSGGTITTGSGRLQINGDVTTLGSTNAATIYGSVLFAGGLRTVTVNRGYAPGGWDVIIPATIGDTGNGIQFFSAPASPIYGPTVVLLEGSNTFTGPLTINGGTDVSPQTPWALGTTNSGTFVTNGGNLFLGGIGITNETVTLAAGTTLTGQWGGQNPIWAGPVVLAGDATIYGFNYLGGIFDIRGAITGSGNLTVLSDGLPVQFSGPLANTYTGTTMATVTGLGSTFHVALLLAKSGSGNAIPNALVISNSCTVRDLADYQINSPTKPVTILDTGVLDLTNHSEWVGALSLQGAQVTTAASGLLYLGGDITVNSSTMAMSQITGNATLWNGTKTINCVGHNYSPDLFIPANLGGNGTSGLIIAAGSGEVGLAGTNSTFPGSVTVNSGDLEVSANNALGNTNTPATVNINGNLFLFSNVAIGLKPLNLSGTGGSSGALSAGFGTNRWAGNITLATNVLIDVYTNSVLELSGIISGPGSLTKIDWGNLLLDGSLSNNFTGMTLLQQGLMTLSKTNGPAVSGPLTIGQGLDGANGDVVFTVLNNQLPTNNTVTISSSGLLDVSGGTSFNNTVGSLTGTGPVHIGNNSFTDGSDNSSTTYSGAISGTASSALIKVGNGAWTLTGTSSFSGIMQVQAGQVFVNGSMPSTDASVINGALLGGVGTLGFFGFTHGTIAPGTNSPGVLNSGSVTLNTNDTFLAAITGTTAGSGYSQLNVTGAVSLGNAHLQLNMPVAGITNSQLTIINNDGVDAVTGTFGGLAEGSTITAASGAQFKISYHGGTGNDVVLTQISLPAPSSFTGIIQLGGGDIQLNGIGNTNTAYTVWANTNLITTNWITIGTAPANVSGQIQFTDTNAPSYKQRFYRFSWP